MSEYIEREVLYKKLLELEALARARVIDTPTTSPEYQRYSAQLTERNAIRHMIAEIPAADVAPVIHGRWITPHGTPVPHCSECCVWGNTNLYGGYSTPKFCPNCEAKMDKEEV